MCRHMQISTKMYDIRRTLSSTFLNPGWVNFVGTVASLRQETWHQHHQVSTGETWAVREPCHQCPEDPRSNAKLLTFCGTIVRKSWDLHGLNGIWKWDIHGFDSLICDINPDLRQFNGIWMGHEWDMNWFWNIDFSLVHINHFGHPAENVGLALKRGWNQLAVRQVRPSWMELNGTGISSVSSKIGTGLPHMMLELSPFFFRSLGWLGWWCIWPQHVYDTPW